MLWRVSGAVSAGFGKVCIQALFPKSGRWQDWRSAYQVEWVSKGG